MARRDYRSWAACGLLTLISPLLIGTNGLTNDLDTRVLAAHNRERAVVGVGPLRWDADLARSAEGWARYLAATGRFEHAPENRFRPEGENIWGGSPGYFSAESMVYGWVREKQFYKTGIFPNNSTTGQVEDVGHYTQLIWGRTGRVGCALAHGAREDILVCRYSQAGNYIGQRPI